MIRFNVPPCTGKEFDYIKKAVENQKICGDGEFTAKCNEWLEKKTGSRKALLTTLPVRMLPSLRQFWQISSRGMR